MGTRKRHTPEQVIAKLREADVELGRGMAVGQVCRKLEVSEHTYYVTEHSKAARREHFKGGHFGRQVVSMVPGSRWRQGGRICARWAS